VTLLGVHPEVYEANPKGVLYKGERQIISQQAGSAFQCT